MHVSVTTGKNNHIIKSPQNKHKMNTFMCKNDLNHSKWNNAIYNAIYIYISMKYMQMKYMTTQYGLLVGE